MAEPRVTELRSVALGVTDVAASAAFYADPWALARVADRGGAVYMRASGPAHHVLSLHQRVKPELLAVEFAVPSKADADALHAKLKANGAPEVEPPAALAGPGGGYGFAFKDCEGRIFRILAGQQRHADAGNVPDRPRKLAHVVLNSADADRAAKFFIDALGFKLSDRTRMFNFLRCSADHHSVSFAHGKGPTLNHIAFDMPDLDSVMRGAGRVRHAGFPIEWGVGRHGPGANVFAYFLDPDGFSIEYTGEVEQVNDSYKVGQPQDWGFPPGWSDRWGVSEPPSKRLHEAQERIGFAEEIVRVE